MRKAGSETDWEVRDPRLRRVEALSWFLDDAIRIPGIDHRIGYDALIGLVPGIGDLLGALLSVYIVVEAARLGVGRATLARMAMNIGLEALVGAVPVLGDLFDATWKANARNVTLIHQDLGVPVGRRTRSNRRFYLGVAGAMLLVLAFLGGLVVLAVWVVQRFWN